MSHTLLLFCGACVLGAGVGRAVLKSCCLALQHFIMENLKDLKSSKDCRVNTHIPGARVHNYHLVLLSYYVYPCLTLHQSTSIPPVGRLDPPIGFRMGSATGVLKRSALESRKAVGSFPSSGRGTCHWLPTGLPAVASAGL